MKRILLALGFCFVLTFPCFAHYRCDVALSLPLAGGTYDFETGSFLGLIFDVPLMLYNVPVIIPEVNLAYCFDLGSLHLASGVRLLTCVLQTVASPTVLAEWRCGSLLAEVQLSGLVIGSFGGFENLIVVEPWLFPDISLWALLGKTHTMRLGVGVVGQLDLYWKYFLPILYCGGKLSFLSGKG